jgi:uncharacterized protein (TIGR02301 family)
MRAPLPFIAALLFIAAPAAPAMALDPPYEPQMERLAEIMGSLYFLQPICAVNGGNWRDEMSQLITLDEPDDDRRQRLAGAFNGGYQAYARLYRACTGPAREALGRLLLEAEDLARDIHAHYAE